MKSHKMPLQHCCYCGVEMDYATCMTKSKERPSPGDLTICLHCSGMHIFTSNLEVRKPTLGELIQFKSLPEFTRVQKVRKLITEMKP